MPSRLRIISTTLILKLMSIFEITETTALTKALFVIQCSQTFNYFV